MFDESIKQAQLLLKNSQDKAHDINHARRVAENACLIGRSVGYSDLKLLELCGWWHDVARIQGDNHEENGALQAQRDLLARGVNEGIAEIVYKAIRFHKWTMSPKTFEGDILRDADKLDFISIDRWEACIKSKQLKHLIDIETLLPKLRDMLKLDSSRQIYDQRIADFQKSGVSSLI